MPVVLGLGSISPSSRDCDIDAILVAPSLELPDSLHLAFISGHDHLAAGVHGKLPFLAVRSPEGVSLPCEPGLERIAGIIEAGVKDSRIASARVEGRDRLLFDEAD